MGKKRGGLNGRAGSGCTRCDRRSQRRWGPTTFRAGWVRALHCRLPPPRAGRTVQRQPLQGKRRVSKGFGYAGRLLAYGVCGNRGLPGGARRLSRDHVTLRASWRGPGCRCAFQSTGSCSVSQRPDARFLASGVMRGQRGAPWLGRDEVNFSRPRGFTEGETRRHQAALSALQAVIRRRQQLYVRRKPRQPVGCCSHRLFFIGFFLLFLQVF